MLLDFYRGRSADAATLPESLQNAERREQIVTVVAASSAVLIVAAIAVLMGMA